MKREDFRSYSTIQEAYQLITEGRHAEPSVYKADGYDQFGVNRDGLFRSGVKAPWYEEDWREYYSPAVMAGWRQQARNRENTVIRRMNGGRDLRGFDREGFDSEGFDANGYDREGFDRKGYDLDGYDRRGFNAEGRNAQGFDKYGYNAEGRDAEGRDEWGFDAEGWDASGFPAPWKNPEAYGLHSEEDVEKWKADQLERIRDKRRGGRKFQAERVQDNLERRQRAKEMRPKLDRLMRDLKTSEKEKVKAEREAYLQTPEGQKELEDRRLQKKELARQKRAEKMASMSPEELEAQRRKSSDYMRDYSRLMYILAGARPKEKFIEDRMFLAMSPIARDYHRRKAEGKPVADPYEFVRRAREAANRQNQRKWQTMTDEEKAETFRNLKEKYGRKPSDAS